MLYNKYRKSYKGKINKINNITIEVDMNYTQNIYNPNTIVLPLHDIDMNLLETKRIISSRTIKSSYVFNFLPIYNKDDNPLWFPESEM